MNDNTTWQANSLELACQVVLACSMQDFENANERSTLNFPL
jgi:hypothetical protein